MKVFSQLPAFACGIAAVLLSYLLFADVHAQPAAREALVACADAAGRLRMKDPAAACPAGEAEVPLKSLGLTPDETPSPDSAVADLGRRLRELEARLRDSSRMLDRKVEAPFEVVNEAGTKVFSVEEESVGDRTVNVFNNAGKQVAWIYGGDDRGWLRTMSATSNLMAEISPDGLIVRDRESPDRRVYLGRINDIRHGLSFSNTSAKIVAAIGQSEAESGIVVIADAQGKYRARMSVPAGGGNITIINAQDIEMATLSVDGRQNGLLQLRNDQGATMVEAGTLDGVGVVRAGPGAFQHAIGFLGLPASYIQGKPE